MALIAKAHGHNADSGADTGANPAGQPRTISILGSTGSIGCSTLDLISRNRGAFDLVALTAHRNVRALVDQARTHRPQLAVISEPDCYAELKAGLEGTGIEAAAGPEAVVEAAGRPADWVMARRSQRLAKLGQILTASGGPFRTWTTADMAKATPAEAVAHPRWDMGAKISVDSATLMNKGLELIEAHYLFPVGEPRLDVVIHPESIVHSMVAYVDGSVLAQLGSPDMRTPISYALAWPGRMATPSTPLDLAAIGQLTFEAPDLEKFPALVLAREALRAGAAAPTVLNAANEVAVAAFLNGLIGFLDIVAVSEAVLADGRGQAGAPADLEAVYEIDRIARIQAQEWVQNHIR